MWNSDEVDLRTVWNSDEADLRGLCGTMTK